MVKRELDAAIDEVAGHNAEINTAEEDFAEESKTSDMASLTKALFDTTVGKLRKSVLTRRQAVALSRARTFAAIHNVPELAALCDVLSDTTVSVNGKGLDQMVQVMTARMAAQDEDGDVAARLGRSLGISR